MAYTSTIRGERFTFPDLRTLFARASEEKSGDSLAGLAAASERERVAAKLALADVPLAEIVENPLIDPGHDEVSRVLLDDLDVDAFAPLRSLTVGQFREFLLDETAGGEELAHLHRAIHPEVAAAVARLMSNKDLILVAAKVRVISRFRNTLGEPGIFAVRTQPNHPADDPAGILLSAVEGLVYGCGDAVIGVNPATESVESVANILFTLDRLITRCQIPAQHCCLAHVTTQLQALERGAPIDILFQSIAGTQKANESFGVSLSLLRESQARVREAQTKRDDPRRIGSNVMYFETGQGSALSSGSHEGVDQLTLEARAYGLARLFSPLLVNSVVGFIGPEYLYDERQITRAGLEDHFMGKLLGLPMGVDVCYTNHAAADQNSLDNLLVLLASAGCNYVMGVPCGDDVMLNYQTTSYHDAVAVRQLFGLQPAPEFARWLEENGICYRGRLAPPEAGRKMLAGLLESCTSR